MFPYLNVLILAVTAIGISGCANLNSIFHEFDVDGIDKRSVSIDAKQRVVLGTKYGVCAEPSPDAMSVLSSAIAAGVDIPDKVGADFSSSLSESGSNIGLRTQTIQLLRDSMFRLCEGYVNGALSPSTFKLLHRRYQNSMLGLLAIEQLTGTIASGQVVLNSGSSVDAGEHLIKLQESVESARTDFEENKKTREKLEEDLKSSEENRKSLETELATLKAALPKDDNAIEQKGTEISESKKSEEESRLNLEISKVTEVESESVLASLKRLRDAAKNPSLSTSASGVLVYQQASTAESIASIAPSVVAIVESIVGADYRQETCLELMRDLVTSVPAEDVKVNPTAETFKQEFRSGGAYQGVVDFCLSSLSTKISSLSTKK